MVSIGQCLVKADEENNVILVEQCSGRSESTKCTTVRYSSVLFGRVLPV